MANRLDVPARIRFFWICFNPAFRWIVAVYTTLAAITWCRDELLPVEWRHYHVLDFLPVWPLYLWISIGLVIVIIAVSEGVYRESQVIREARVQKKPIVDSSGRPYEAQSSRGRLASTGIPVAVAIGIVVSWVFCSSSREPSQRTPKPSNEIPSSALPSAETTSEAPSPQYVPQPVSKSPMTKPDTPKALESDKQQISPKPSTEAVGPLVDPAVDLAIGQPFGSTTIITVKNTGVDLIVDFAANLRCFLLRAPDDPQPMLFFEGFPSIGNKYSWWSIEKIKAGVIHTKDAKESLARCLHNRQVTEESPMLHTVFADMIVSVDIVYHRKKDYRRYHKSGIARLMRDSRTGEPFLSPLPMSDYYRRMLQTVAAPAYRVDNE